MMTLSRRFLVLLALMFWQGGFLFYAAVVVPIGQQEFGHKKQGFITRRVTDYLNLAGAAALVPLAWDTAVSRERSARLWRLRWVSWVVMLLALALLAWLHPRMDDLLDMNSRQVMDPPVFRAQHRWYLWVSTIQWAAGVIYAALTLWAWRDEDRVSLKEV